MTAARALMRGARTITTGKQLRGQCDGTTSNVNRLATHVGPNALLRRSTYPNVSASPGSGALTAPTVPGIGYWTINGSTEFSKTGSASPGLCTNWAGSPGSSGAAPAYVYNNLTSNLGGIVPSGGMSIDGFAVPAGAYVFQFMDFDSGMGISSGAPAMVFRGCRARAGGNVGAPGVWNASSGGYDNPFWFLYCDIGGTSAPEVAVVMLDIQEASGITIYRSYASYVTTAFQVDATCPTTDIIECYIEKLTNYSGSHLDGIATNGSNTNFRFLRNYIVAAEYDENDTLVDQTTCLEMIQDGGPYPGTGTNPDGTPGYQIIGNYVGGTGYCFYLGQNYYEASGDDEEGSGTTTTLTVEPSPGWTTNEWAGYKLAFVQGTGNGETATIVSNTANVLAFDAVTTAPDGSTVFQFWGTVKNLNFQNNLITTSIYPILTPDDAPGEGGGYFGPYDTAPPWGQYGNTKSGNLWADGSYDGASVAGTTFI
jgi:hypothetical protein